MCLEVWRDKPWSYNTNDAKVAVAVGRKRHYNMPGIVAMRSATFRFSMSPSTQTNVALGCGGGAGGAGCGTHSGTIWCAGGGERRNLRQQRLEMDF